MTQYEGMETLSGIHVRLESETDWFETTDGLRLFARAWLPEATPRATIALVHGYGEHSGRYAHVASFLTQAGYAVYAYDQRGYGRSEGARAYVAGFSRYVADLGTFLAHVRAKQAEGRLFLMGHSMGGTVSACYAIEAQPALDGLILSSPFLMPGEEIPSLPPRLTGLASRLLPSLPTIALDRTCLSHDPAVVRATEHDPLYYRGRIKARTGHEMLRGAGCVRGGAQRLGLPLLIFHGTADRIAHPRGSTELYGRAGSADKTLGLYDGLYHETLNEPQKEQVLDELTTWLEEHL